jgi:1-acyl-sn-glycerol-3-phosphate acyltransferase
VSLSGAVFVDRKNNKDAVKLMNQAGEDMKKNGVSIAFATVKRSNGMRPTKSYRRLQISLWVFPEGTRSSTSEPNLLPFKKGAFHLAVQGEFKPMLTWFPFPQRLTQNLPQLSCRPDHSGGL